LAAWSSRPVETVAELGEEADSLLGWMAGAVEGHVAGEGEDSVVQALFDEVMRLRTELEEAHDTVVELTIELNDATGLRCDFAGSATEALEKLAQAAGAADDEGTKQWEQIMADLSESRAEASNSKKRCDHPNLSPFPRSALHFWCFQPILHVNCRLESFFAYFLSASVLCKSRRPQAKQTVPVALFDGQVRGARGSARADDTILCQCCQGVRRCCRCRLW
jgi:hypothetical protein